MILFCLNLLLMLLLASGAPRNGGMSSLTGWSTLRWMERLGLILLVKPIFLQLYLPMAIIILLGLTQVLSVHLRLTVTPAPFQGHLDAVPDRENVKGVRTVGTALRLSLVNSADQNEGYWECAHVPTSALDFTFSEPDPVGAPGVLNSAASMTMGDIDLSNYQTYLTGKLRDIYRYQFKLNAIDNDVNFSRILSEPPQVDQFVSEQWDTIIVKVHGRVEIGAPSMMMYDCISCQEVMCKENTALARLMTTSPYVPQTKSLLTRTRFNPPGVQIS